LDLDGEQRLVVGRALLLAAALLMPSLAGGQQKEPASEPGLWSRTKCERYTKAWQIALARSGPTGLGAAFLTEHEAFLASGCSAPARVCPRSAEELALANVMVIAAMNAGMASTFLPFACRRAD